MVEGAIVEKFCARSHGHPVPGARSAAMISMRRAISREGMTAMSDDPRRPGTLRCYQGSALPCKPSAGARKVDLAGDRRYPLRTPRHVHGPVDIRTNKEH